MKKNLKILNPAETEITAANERVAELAALFEKAERLLRVKWSCQLINSGFVMRKTSSPAQQGECGGCPAPWAAFYLKQKGCVYRRCEACVRKLWNEPGRIFFCYNPDGVVVNLLPEPPVKLGNRYNQHPTIYQMAVKDLPQLREEVAAAERRLEKCSNK